MIHPISLFSTEVTSTLQAVADRLSRLAPADGPRVLILPGLPGSRLGHRGPPREEAIWFDLGALRDGRFMDLAYDVPLDVLGLFEALYLRMVLRLRLGGYDVGFYPYDWRRPIADVAAELAAHLQAEGREVHVIAHSFGSLVLRAAMVAGAPNLGRKIMLGPPNRGTFEMVQALRGSAWPLHLVSALDGRHGAVELADRVVATWPSIPEALPDRMDPSELDLFDLASWPAEGLRPDPAILARAARAQASLVQATGDFAIIAGHGLPTVERVEVEGGVFRYHGSDAGDGLVGVARAQIEGQPCYHVRAAHIGMPNHADVIEAVHDLLAHGATDHLSRTAPDPTPTASFTDADPRALPFGGRRGSEIDLADLHDAFDQLAGFVVPALV